MVEKPDCGSLLLTLWNGAAVEPTRADAANAELLVAATGPGAGVFSGVDPNLNDGCGATGPGAGVCSEVDPN